MTGSGVKLACEPASVISAKIPICHSGGVEGKGVSAASLMGISAGVLRGRLLRMKSLLVYTEGNDEGLVNGGTVVDRLGRPASFNTFVTIYEDTCGR